MQGFLATVGILDDFVTCFLTDVEKAWCLHCFPSSSLEIAIIFTFSLRMEHDIANTKSHLQHVANSEEICSGAFFPPLSNSDGLSCLLCKCCQKVFSAGSHKQKYTTWSQRLHPCACLKVEKKKQKNLVLICGLITRGDVLCGISHLSCLFHLHVFLIVGYSLKSPCRHTSHILWHLKSCCE